MNGSRVIILVCGKPLYTSSSSTDRVFIAEERTHQLYQEIAKPLVVSAVEGHNGLC